MQQPRDVTAEFDDVPLAEALERLLGDQNFVLAYGRGDRLRAIKLLGGPLAPIKVAVTPPPVPEVAPPKSDVPQPRDPGGAVAMLDGHPAVPISGRLAQALGTDAASFRQLFDAAAHNADARQNDSETSGGSQATTCPLLPPYSIVVDYGHCV